MNSNRFFENSVALAMFALLAAFLCSQAKADDTNLNAKTPVTEWVYQGAAFADMLTTLDIAKHPNLVEENPLMGQHPSDGKVLGYFAATGVLHYLVTRELVRLEVGMVAHNYSIGLRVRLP